MSDEEMLTILTMFTDPLVLHLYIILLGSLSVLILNSLTVVITY